MKELDPMVDSVFRMYADLVLDRHRLLSTGKDESAAIVEAEERMDALWPGFDEAQRRSLKGMESDLNWIRRKGAPPPKGRKATVEVVDHELRELSAAIKSEGWHRILHYLRLCAPAFQSASLARERGIAYQAIGFPGYARIFINSVAEFAPLNTHDRHAVIHQGRNSDANAQALIAAPKNAVLVWETNGVKVAAQSPNEDRVVETVAYKACA